MRRLRLTRLNWDRERPGPTEYFPGDKCPEDCRDENGKRGVIGVYRTIPGPHVITRYLCCKTCGFLPENKLIEPIQPDD